MKLSGQIIEFCFMGVPLVGNPENGYVLGLTSEGASLCKRMMEEDVPLSEVESVDPNLPFHLERGGFLGEEGQKSIETIYFHVTQRCNLKCVGCYSDDERRNCEHDASYDDITKAIDKIAFASPARLIISGGEPFLRRDLARIVQYATCEAGIGHIDILTNGTEVDVGQLVAMAPYVDRVSVSFDGVSKESVSYIRGGQRYEELVQAVQEIKGCGISPHIIATIHSKNIEDMDDYKRLAEKLGATLNFSLLSCVDEDEETKSLLFDDRDLVKLSSAMLFSGGVIPAFADAPMNTTLSMKTSCGAGSGTYSIGSDGTVYPCHMMHNRCHAMGSLFAEDAVFPPIGEVAEEFSVLDVERFEECESCETKYFCGGGCRARAFHSTRSLYAKDPYCALVRDFYSRLFGRITVSK